MKPVALSRDEATALIGLLGSLPAAITRSAAVEISIESHGYYSILQVADLLEAAVDKLSAALDDD